MLKKIFNLFLINEPYRIFFVVGLFSAFSGVLLWPLFQWGGISFYPREAHANLLVFGFFYAFVAGFFMTAIPRMTGSSLPHLLEIFLGLSLILLQVYLAFSNQIAYQTKIYGLQLILLVFFLLRRVLEKRKIPFEGFYFIPFAMFWSFLGLYLNFSGIYRNLSDIFPLLVDAFLLNLICGLGSRLLPVISRMPHTIQPTESFPQIRKMSFLASAIVLNLSFIFYLFGERHFGNFVIGIYLVFHAVVHFSIFEKPLKKSVAHYGFKVAVVTMVFSKLLVSIPHFNFIALNHLFYISGLFLLTLLVATRVMLAHGAQDLNYEILSLRLKWVIRAIVFAGLLRWYAGPEVHSLSLLLSSLIFMGVVVIWGHKFIKILKQSYLNMK